MEINTLIPGEQWHLGQRYICENKPLGDGRYSVVYRAHDTHLNRPVALKTSRGTTADVQERFQKEAEVMAQIHHISVPRVYDYEVQDTPHQSGAAILVMDYIEGPNLQEALNTDGAILSSSEATRVVQQTASLIDYLDSKKIHHGDLTPSSIFPQQPVVQITDFGSCDAVCLGRDNYTDGYSAPERVLGERTLATEEFSLAAIVYTIVTGSPVRLMNTSQDTPLPQVKYQHITELNTRYKLSKEKMQSLNELFEKALAQDPEARYTSAEGFAQAFAQAMERVEPIGHVRDRILHHMLG